MAARRQTKRRPGLLIVGGYGLVGARTARLIRNAHPNLRLILGGRNPDNATSLAAEIDAEVVRVDVNDYDPLKELTGDVTAVLGVVTDPEDRLLRESIRRGLAFADINRAGLPSTMDAALGVTRDRPTAPVLLSGSFYCGLTALVAGRLHQASERVERVDITLLSSSDDEVGPNSWGFAERLPWPYYPSREGKRHVAHPLTETRKVRCADGVVRPASLIGTLEQTTLPVLLDIPTVEARMALFDSRSLGGLRVLKRTGALRMLARPELVKAKEAVFAREGAGDFAGLSVVVTGSGPVVSADLLTPNGQAHLSAIGAACAADLLLSGSLPPGLSFPEQFVDLCDPLERARRDGVVVKTSGLPQETIDITTEPEPQTKEVSKK